MASVLVVDDDDLYRDYLATVLQRAGHVVRELGDGRKVPEFLAGQHFDALITDLYMPHVDGLETVRSARQLVPDLLIINISGALEKGRMHGGRALAAFGAEYVLAKPVKPERLLDLLEQALAGRGTEGRG